MLLLPVLISSAMLGQHLSDSFPDIPENHWAYESLAHLQREKLLKGDPRPKHFTWSGRPYDREEVARMVALTAINLPTFTWELARQDSASAELNELRAVSALPRLINYFSREIVAIGGDPTQLISLVNRTEHKLRNDIAEDPTYQFPDVPKGHWAYRDVLDLKILGLLDGYPGGAFATRR